MSSSTNPLARWLRSRQLLTDSGYGVGARHTYPYFAVTRLAEQLFELAVIMPPCHEDNLSIQLHQQDLVITALGANDSGIECEHRLRLAVPATLAGANWERGHLVLELFVASRRAFANPNQLVEKYHGQGAWLEQQTQRAA